MKLATLTPASLTTKEATDLAKLEAVVELGAKQFVAVGNALTEIRDRRLYRATHDSFDLYAQERFGFKRCYGLRLIDAALVATVAHPSGMRITSERQARGIMKTARRESKMEGMSVAAQIREVVRRIKRDEAKAGADTSIDAPVKTTQDQIDEIVGGAQKLLKRAIKIRLDISDPDAGEECIRETIAVWGRQVPIDRTGKRAA